MLVSGSINSVIPNTGKVKVAGRSMKDTRSIHHSYDMRINLGH